MSDQRHIPKKVFSDYSAPGKIVPCGRGAG
jgi:hypothetical protein